MGKRGPKPKTIEERFWRHVEKAGEDECWLWVGAGNGPEGYGRFHDGEKLATASSVAWRLTYEMDVPEGLVVMHSCNVKRCCNPKHLSIGTESANVRDAYRDGLNGAAKLSPEKVRFIRESVATGSTAAELAARFRVHVRTIHAVLRGHKWGWVK
jgi:hypothetical protein